MSMVAKILIVLNLVLAVLVMGAAGSYLQGAENWKKNYEDNKVLLEGKITDLNDRVGKTQAALDEANRKASAEAQKASGLESANRTLDDNQKLLNKKIDDYNAQLQALQNHLKDLQANYEASRQANDKLQAEKKQADDEKRSALEAKNAAETEQKRLEQDRSNLTAQLDGSEKSKAELADQREALTAENKMYREKFGPLGLVATAVKGQVLAADAKMDIYLISVGSKDGVKVADELTVYRNDQFVAVVVVDKVFDDKASVVVKRMNGKPFKKSDIQQGDKVATSY
jgi:prefoldin subunit 5